MKLIECYVENFGLLHRYKVEFNKGINCWNAHNGAGKTTLTSFIEAMFYGVGDGRKLINDEKPRKKYTPWQGGRFGGSLTFEVGKKKYRIERTFGQRPADDVFAIVDADTGRPVEDYTENVGQELFGIDRDGFQRTVFLSEKNLQGKNENKTIAAKLSDLVGVDGDVGGVDDAIKILEKRRQFYLKKNKTGEITNVKERISECNRRIDELTRLNTVADAKESRLAELYTEKARLTELDREQRQKLVAIAAQKEKHSHEEIYAAMRANLKTEHEKLAVAKQFFGEKIPYTGEIDKARDAYIEGKRLQKEIYTTVDSEDYVALREFFGSGTDFVEIAEMERHAITLRDREHKLLDIKSEKDPISIEMKRIFRDKIPGEKQISAYDSDTKNKLVVPGAIGIGIGCVLAVAGLIIGGALGYAAAGVGAALLVAGILMLAIKKNNKELVEFVEKYSTDDTKSPKERLEDIKKNLQRYSGLMQERAKNQEEIEAEIKELKATILKFLGKFPKFEAPTIPDALSHIRREFTRYYSLSKVGEQEASNKIDKLRRSEELLRQAHEFASNYPTVTDQPFDEIREKLIDYNYLLVNIQKMENECDAFAVRHELSGNIVIPDDSNEAIINDTIKGIADKIEEINRECAVLESETRTAQTEIDKIDELNSAKAELEEMLAKYTESYETILKTSVLLKEACNNITAKYIGKTKTRFEEYCKSISGVDGDFAINTSFELTKAERGESHTADEYSRGTRDLYSLALRLAMVDALYENESPFIILDDPFTAFDDEKIEKAKLVLKAIARDRQILYFTCSDSRTIK